MENDPIYNDDDIPQGNQRPGDLLKAATMNRLYKSNDTVLIRLALSIIIIIFSSVLSATYLGAAYQNVLYGSDLLDSFARLFGSAALGGGLGALLVLYPFERWVIRTRAASSWQWTVGRLVLYSLCGIPIGWIVMWSLRIGSHQVPEVIETSYYLIAVISSGFVGLLFSFMERLIAIIRQREAKLKSQIAGLKIEIDYAYRQRQVQEVTETEFFRNLQARAAALRERAGR